MHDRWTAEAATHQGPHECDIIGSEVSVKAEYMCRPGVPPRPPTPSGEPEKLTAIGYCPGNLNIIWEDSRSQHDSRRNERLYCSSRAQEKAFQRLKLDLVQGQGYGKSSAKIQLLKYIELRESKKKKK